MWRWISIALGCAAVLAGCAYGEVRQVVRAQFAAELDCPEVLIQKRDVWYAYDSVDQYKVSGCGVMRTYSCPPSDGLVSYDEPVCTWVAGDADAPVPPKPVAMDDEDDPMADPEPVAEEPAAEPAHVKPEKPEAKPEKPEAKPEKPEAKPEAKPAETTPEVKPQEAKPADLKPTEVKPEQKPAKAKGGIKAGGGIKLGGSGKAGSDKKAN